jgi:thymidylate synthase ThyX
MPDLYVPDGDGNPKFWVKTECSVYLAGSSQIHWHGDAMSPFEVPGLGDFYDDEGLPAPPGQYTSDAGDAGTIAEVAGRLCYWSFENPRPGGHQAYMDRIVKEGHGSVLEHATMNFIVTGVSRTLTHELVRHRIASYSQLSQRFYREHACAFICPPLTARVPALRDRWLNVMETCYDSYVDQVAAMEAEPKYDGPYAALSSSRPADQEIRRMAWKMFLIAREVFPSCFKDYLMCFQEGYGHYVDTEHQSV